MLITIDRENAQPVAVFSTNVRVTVLMQLLTGGPARISREASELQGSAQAVGSPYATPGFVIQGTDIQQFDWIGTMFMAAGPNNVSPTKVNVEIIPCSL